MDDSQSILVVDDEKGSRITLAALLEAEGYRVKACETAEEALAQTTADPPNIIVSDLKLPNVIGKLSLTPGKVRSTGPRLGQHNDETFKGFLGYSDEKIAALKYAGAI